MTTEKVERLRREPKRMPIMEIFGPTIQGEGMVIGRKTMFVRTGGCDYSCVWCDSAFTWNGEEKAEMMSPKEVYDKLYELGTTEDGKPNFDHVTISGGNPALIKDPMNDLIDLLHADGVQVGLETQGSFWREWMLKIDDLTISPKPPSSAMITNWHRLDEIVNRLTEGDVNVTLKVVIFDDADFEYARKVHHRYPHVPFFVSVGNEDAHEEGDISGRLLKKLGWLWDKVINDPDFNGVKPLPQLHTLVWANRRKV